MLRGKFKTKLIYGGTLLAAFSLTIGSAWSAELASLEGSVNQLKNSTTLKCLEPDYWNPPMGMTPKTPKTPLQQQMCQSQCMQGLRAQADAIELEFRKAIASDAAANSSSAANSAGAAAAGTGQAVVQQGAQNVSGAGAKAGLAQKSANAKAVAAKAKACPAEIDKACPKQNIAQNDMTTVQQAKTACEQLATGSEAVAAEKAASSGGMGDMSQLASALGQALGPLAQMMAGQQQQPDTSSTDPYNSGYSTPTNTVAGTSLGTNANPLAGTAIGNSTTPSGTEFKAAKNNITGFTPTAASNFGPGSSGYGSGSGYGDSASGGTGMGSGAYSAGSSGSGSLNSSGSSMSPGDKDAEKAAAAAANAAGENYEVMATGGGGSRPSFLGLKGRAEEDLGAGSGESVLGDLGLGDEGSRDLASADELGGGIGEAEGETLFRVIHTKIAEIKKRGSI
jgi:hypothetical protein